MLHHMKMDQLHAVAGWGVDKKHSVSTGGGTVENKDSAAILQFVWIPHELFQMIKVTSGVRPLVEDTVAEFILPLPSASSAPSTSKSASANVGEVDEVMVFLDDEHSMNTLLAFSRVQRACVSFPECFVARLTAYTNSHLTIFEHFVKACITNNEDVIDDEEAVTAKLEGLYPDPHKMLEDLHTDLKGLVKATNEFVERIDTLNSGIVPTMNLITVLYNFSLLVKYVCSRSDKWMTSHGEEATIIGSAAALELDDDTSDPRNTTSTPSLSHWRPRSRKLPAWPTLYAGLLSVGPGPSRDVLARAPRLKEHTDHRAVLQRRHRQSRPGYGIDLQQASLHILNQSSIPTLIKCLQKLNSLAVDNALKLLTFLSKRQLELYKTHIGELVKGVADKKHLKVMELVVLQALVAVVRLDEKVVLGDN
ncbi:hypothetical protein DFH08DRAFT_1045582 [Mycena albidolilacea]|uniref:Uncharacterized protein n=1 Tax=Mycena albidolilacea TaxID=1033008 RepID=A0AAD6Z8T9_9AGAR|nr:hypothetical protein DFH08DRAFT_1045582 [Mycena albidolilacea]